jgi:hypothetical protein
MGASLKIGRPSKYDGPVTTATSWSHILLSLGADAVDGMSPAALVLKAGGADTSLVALENDATKCELFIANLCPESNASTLAAFLEALAVEAAIDVQTGGAIKSVRVSGTYAFLETRSHSDTSAYPASTQKAGEYLRSCKSIGDSKFQWCSLSWPSAKDLPTNKEHRYKSWHDKWV